MASSRLSTSIILQYVASRISCSFRPTARLPAVRWASFAAQPQSEQSEGPTFTPKGPETADTGEDQPTFSSLRDKINPAVLKAITVKPFNFTTMSVVQAAVLPMLPGLAVPYNAKEPSSSRQDLLVKAKTGTGKTLGFIVPAIEARLKAIDAYGKQAVIDAGLDSDPRLEARARDVYARTHAGCLIISPTRELATQIANEAIRLSHHIKGFETRLFVGGESKRMQMRDWMHGSRDIVVATPGRIRDVLESEPEVLKGLEKTPMVCAVYILFYQHSSLILSSLSLTKLTRFWKWVSVKRSLPLPTSFRRSRSDRRSCSPLQFPGKYSRSLARF